jgi:uncharacterized protein (TIGR02099 family)
MLRNSILTRLQSLLHKHLLDPGSLWRKRILLFIGIFLSTLLLGYGGIRFVIWPQIEKSKPTIERLLSTSVGANVTLGDIQITWTEFRPSFEIQNLRIDSANPASDKASNKVSTALSIERISGQLAWISLYHIAPYFHQITFDNAQIYAQRDAKGIISVAGIPLEKSSNDHSAGNWLLHQGAIDIHHAHIFWDDALNEKNKANVEIQNLHLENGIRSHQGTLTAQTPWSPERIQIDADFEHHLGSQAGNWRNWEGDISWNISNLSLTRLAQEFTLPLHNLTGNFSSKGKQHIDSGKLDGGQYAFSAEQFIAQLNKDEEALEFGKLEADLVQDTDSGLLSITANTLAWQDKGANSTSPLEKLSPLTFRWRPPEAGGEIKEFGFSSPKLLVEDIAVFALNLPLPKKIHQWIKLSKASGELQNVDIKWAEKKSAFASLPLPGSWFNSNRLDFNVSATLQDVSFTGFNPSIPSIAHLSGNLISNQKQGNFTLNAQGLEIKLADFLTDPLLKLDKAKGNLSWVKQKDHWQIDAKEAALSNPDLDLSFNLRYFLSGPKEIDNMTLDMKFANAKVVNLYRYLPIGMSAESRQYLAKAFEGGTIQNGSVHIKGDPNQIPYARGETGEFTLHLPISNVTLKPAPLIPSNDGVWSPLENIHGNIDMAQSNLQIELDSARYKQVSITNIHAQILNVSASNPKLLINADVEGDAPEILDYLFKSSVGKNNPSVVKNLKVSGPLNMNLEAKVPLSGSEDASVDAKVTLPGNQAQWAELPPFEKLRGNLRITEQYPKFDGITANFLGGQLQISSAATSPDNATFNINGDISAKFVKDYFSEHPQHQIETFLNAMSGSAKFTGAINYNKAGTDTQIRLDLRNWASKVPKPFSKLTGVPLLGEISLQTHSANKISSSKANWSVKLGDQLALLGNLDTANDVQLALGIGTIGTLPQQGLSIHYVANDLDLDSWKDFIGSAKPPQKSIDLKSASLIQDDIAFTAKVKKARLLNRDWTDLNLSGASKNNQWQLRSASPQIAGQLTWHPANPLSPSGLISGSLTRLKIPEENLNLSHASAVPLTQNAKQLQPDAPINQHISPNAIPSLDLSIDDFLLGKAELGNIKIKSQTTPDLLLLEALQIANAKGTIVTKGQWQGKTANVNERSSIQMDIAIKDAGGIIGYWRNPSPIEGGHGKLLGELNWRGPIYAPDYETLNGKVDLNLANGRLLEVNTSGAQLLDILSLQSLLKFATLDLQGTLGNLATKGTVFNAITGNFDVAQGIAKTQQFNMNLDQARVTMTGQIDIPQQTQDLRVTIFPTIDATAGSLAAFVINPIVGLSVLAGQYLLTSQINRSLQTDYLVQGSWTNPEVISLNQRGQPLDDKTLQTIRSKELLIQQNRPNTPNNSGTQPRFPPSSQ